MEGMLSRRSAARRRGPVNTSRSSACEYSKRNQLPHCRAIASSSGGCRSLRNNAPACAAASRTLGLLARAVWKQPYPGLMPPAVGLRAVITDWGGVLTPPITQLVRAWAMADQIDWESYVTAVGPWLKAAYEPDSAPNPVHELERGECTVAEFEALLAERLVRI